MNKNQIAEQIDELYDKIEDVVGDTDLMEGKDMPLEMVRALNILNNEKALLWAMLGIRRDQNHIKQ